MAKKRAKVELDLFKKTEQEDVSLDEEREQPPALTRMKEESPPPERLKEEATPADEPEEKPKKDQRVDLSGRVTYQVGQELKEAIREESVRLRVPASQLAKYLLLYAWDDYINGRIPPPTLLDSDSPAYMFNIDFEE